MTPINIEDHSKVVAARLLAIFDDIGIDEAENKYDNCEGGFPCTVFGVNGNCCTDESYGTGPCHTRCDFYGLSDNKDFDVVVKMALRYTKPRPIPFEEIEIPSIGINGKWRLA